MRRSGETTSSSVKGQSTRSRNRGQNGCTGCSVMTKTVTEVHRDFSISIRNRVIFHEEASASLLHSRLRSNWRKLKTEQNCPMIPLPLEKIKNHSTPREELFGGEELPLDIEPFDVINRRHGLGNVGIIDAGFTRFAAHRGSAPRPPRRSFSPC